MFEVKKSLTVTLFLTSLWYGGVQAEDVKMYTGRAPSAVEMGNILFSKQSGIKMRSISFGKAKSSVPTMSYQQGLSQTKSSIGLPIKFAYNSTTILSESMPFLDEVGKMLQMSDYANKKLVVEGHTDASGSKRYNQHLSEKRAAAVKRYLMNNFSIAENRLFVNGVGENQPLSGMNPYAAVNRRVQFYSAL